MLTLTPEASEYLLEISEEADLPEDGALRLIATPDGLRIQEDELRPGDITFEHHGQLILVMNDPMAQRCIDRTLDIILDLEGPILALREEFED